jgi:hypothetical protein
LIFRSIPTKYQNRNKHSPHLLHPFSAPIVIAVYQSTSLKVSHSKQGGPTSFETKVITASLTPSNGVEMVDVRDLLNISERVAHFRNQKSEASDRLLFVSLKKLIQTTSKSLLRLTPRKHEHEQLFEAFFEHQKDGRSARWESG